MHDPQWSSRADEQSSLRESVRGMVATLLNIPVESVHHVQACRRIAQLAKQLNVTLVGSDEEDATEAIRSYLDPNKKGTPNPENFAGWLEFAARAYEHLGTVIAATAEQGAQEWPKHRVLLEHAIGPLQRLRAPATASQQPRPVILLACGILPGHHSRRQREVATRLMRRLTELLHKHDLSIRITGRIEALAFGAARDLADMLGEGADQRITTYLPGRLLEDQPRWRRHYGSVGRCVSFGYRHDRNVPLVGGADGLVVVAGSDGVKDKLDLNCKPGFQRPVVTTTLAGGTAARAYPQVLKQAQRYGPDVLQRLHVAGDATAEPEQVAEALLEALLLMVRPDAMTGHS